MPNSTPTPALATSPSPAFSHPSPLPKRTFERTQSQQLATALDVDLSLPTAVSHLVSHLLHPLSSHYAPSTLNLLRAQLTRRLEDTFRDTWDEDHPQHGSGFRSLICSKRLPRILREAAEAVSVDEQVWRHALSARKGREDDEDWEAWCDPGAVVWRYGGWEWEDVGFEPSKVFRGPFQIIWQGGTEPTPASTSSMPSQGISLTPARPSHAIPIRAPTVFAIPPTPAAPSTHLAFPPSPLDGLGDHPEEAGDGSHPDSPIFSSAATSAADNVPASAFAMQSELGLGPAPFFSRSTSPSFSDGSMISLSSAFSQRDPQLRGVSDSSADSADSEHDNVIQARRSGTRGTHRGSESLSSVASSASESNSGHTQLLTPASRPGSADPFNINVPHLSIKDRESDKDKDKEREMMRMRKITPPMLALQRGRTPSPSPHTPDQPSTTPGTETTITPSSVLPPSPSVTPYDGGNVTVLGGGVKLGGGGTSSRSVSSMSHRSTSGGNGLDRSRSPSVSLASRALNTALAPGEGETPTTRKQRTRRRIMPTYLGHLGQPGVGGPINGVFGQFVGKPLHPTPTANFVPQQHVGVGVAPPPVTAGGVGARSSSGSSAQRM